MYGQEIRLAEQFIQTARLLDGSRQLPGPLDSDLRIETDHAHAMERYAFLRAATIYGGSDEVQKTVLAKSLLGKTAA